LRGSNDAKRAHSGGYKEDKIQVGPRVSGGGRRGVAASSEMKILFVSGRAKTQKGVERGR